MKNKSSKLYTKKRNILFKSFSDINLVFTKEVKLESKALINPLKKSYTHKRFHLNKGQIPIFSKNKNIILIVENNYDKKILQGKSPFFISDKLNFKTTFRYPRQKFNVKQKHLGLCDYYQKIKEKKIIPENEIDSDSDNSKTPRFNRD